MANKLTSQLLMAPLVSIGMPIYNAGPDLVKAVRSIINQSYPNWELFIVDDGSTDNCLAFIEDIKDKRIVVIRDGLNKGLAVRLNECIKLARGEYFARMDQDDIAYPTRLEKQVEILKENGSLDLIATRAITISPDGSPVGYLPYALRHEEIVKSPWKGFYLPHPTWMGRIDWFNRYRYADPGPYLCEDQELLLRSFKESNFACLDDILLAYRVRSKVSLKKLIKIRFTLFKIQLNKFSSEFMLEALVKSFFMFLAKVLKDTLNTILDRKFSPHKVNFIDAADLKNLNNLLESVSNKQ